MCGETNLSQCPTFPWQFYYFVITKLIQVSQHHFKQHCPSSPPTGQDVLFCTFASRGGNHYELAEYVLQPDRFSVTNGFHNVIGKYGSSPTRVQRLLIVMKLFGNNDLLTDFHAYLNQVLLQSMLVILAMFQSMHLLRPP